MRALLGAGAATFAGDFSKQLNTALAHAEYSSKSNSVKTVHLHPHHVINCLEGSCGKDFNAAAGNPCEGQGDGALNDLSGHSKAREALGLATIAARIDGFQPSKTVALAVKELLQAAAK